MISCPTFLIFCFSNICQTHSFFAHHSPLVAQAEGADVLGLSWLVRSSGGGGADMEKWGRWRVARLSIMKPFTQKQHVSQMADVAAGQA